MTFTEGVRVGRKGLPIDELPYTIRVYINNQVLVPANLVRTLGLDKVKYVDVVMEYNGYKIEINNVRLLRTRHTASRQFTIPREVRERFGIRPLDEVTIYMIIPRQAPYQRTN